MAKKRPQTDRTKNYLHDWFGHKKAGYWYQYRHVVSKDNTPLWECKLRVDGFNYIGVGKSKDSQKEASMKAAEDFVVYLIKDQQIKSTEYPFRQLLVSSGLSNRPEVVAEYRDEEGNRLFRQKKYSEALLQYSSAIGLCPKVAKYYDHRSDCHKMSSNYELALKDVMKVTELDKNFINGYLKQMRCHIIFGDISSAKRCHDSVKALNPNNSSLLQEKKCLNKLEKYDKKSKKHLDVTHDYQSALNNTSKALEIATQSRCLRLRKAECLVLLKRYSEGQEIVDDVLRVEPRNADALYIRGMSLFHTNKVGKAFEQFQQALHYNPDHKKTKLVIKISEQLMSQKQVANKALKSNWFEDAIRSALTPNPLNPLTNHSFINCYLKEAKRHIKSGDISSAKQYLDLVKDLDPNNTSLLQEKKCLDNLEKYDKKSKKHLDVGLDYQSALNNTSKALEIATQSRCLRLRKAECLVLLGKNSEGQEIVDDVLRLEPLNVDALYIRGLSSYYTNKVEKAFQQFQQILQYNPNHEKTKLVYKKAEQLMSCEQEVKEAQEDNRMEEVIRLYTSALTIDPLNTLTNAKLHFNRSIALAKFDEESVDDCWEAIDLDKTYINAYIRANHSWIWNS